MAETQEKSRRFELFTMHEYIQDRQVRTSWLRIGTGWKNRKDEFLIRLNALPVTNPKTGTADLYMRLPRPREEAPTGSSVQPKPEDKEDCDYTSIDPISGIPMDEL